MNHIKKLLSVHTHVCSYNPFKKKQQQTYLKDVQQNALVNPNNSRIYRSSVPSVLWNRPTHIKTSMRPLWVENLRQRIGSVRGMPVETRCEKQPVASWLTTGGTLYAWLEWAATKKNILHTLDIFRPYKLIRIIETLPFFCRKKNQHPNFMQIYQPQLHRCNHNCSNVEMEIKQGWTC